MVLIAIMCVTTFITQKQIAKRSGPVEGQAATVQKLMLYGMPLSLFVSGFFFPIGVLIYWVTNNAWTFGQQFFILRKMPPPGSPAALAKAADDKPVVDPRTLAPKPGAKPVRAQARPARRRRGRPGVSPEQPCRRRRRASADGTGRPAAPPGAAAWPARRRRTRASASGADPGAGVRTGRPRRRRHATDHRARPAHRTDLGGTSVSAPQQPAGTAATAEATSDAALSPAPPTPATDSPPALPDADAASDDAVVEPVDVRDRAAGPTEAADETTTTRTTRTRTATTRWSARATSPATTSSACSTSSTSTATSTSTSRATAPPSPSSAAGSTTWSGRDGATLDALQELTRLAVAQSTGVRSRLMLDVGGFRAKRRADLTAPRRRGRPAGRPEPASPSG